MGFGVVTPRREAPLATQHSTTDADMHCTHDSLNAPHTEGEVDHKANRNVPQTPTILNNKSPDKSFMSGGDWDERQLTTLNKVLEKKKKHMTSY